MDDFRQTFELDFGSDDLLLENAFKSFHDAASCVDSAMKKWKEEYDEINKKTSMQGDLQSTMSSTMD